MQKGIETTILTARSKRARKAIGRAAQLLRDGECVVFPTETVYGLGADAFNASAVKHIFAIKGRPSDNPLIVHISDISMLKRLVREIPPQAQQLMDAFWPGPLTILFPVADRVPRAVTAGLRTIAIRMPSHQVARELITQAQTPIAAPSANSSGLPSTTTAQHAWDDLLGKVPLILDAGPSHFGVESTVVDARRSVYILRSGSITAQDIAQITQKEPTLATQVHNGKARSPGQKYRHYSPKAPLYWIRQSGRTGLYTTGLVLSRLQKTTDNVALISPKEHIRRFPRADIHVSLGHLNNATSQAQALFAALRSCDASGAKSIVIEGIDEEGVGQAIVERLERAATAIYTTINDVPTDFSL